MNSLVNIELTEVNHQVVIEPHNFITTIEVNDEFYNYVEIQEGSLVINEPLVSITEVAPIGIPGPPGSSNLYYNSINHIITSSLDNTYILPQIPKPNSLALYLNGLRESNSSFILTGNTVDYSSLDIDIGDLIIFDYQYEL